MSIIWQFFKVCPEDETKARCTLCQKVYSRGCGKAKSLTTSNLLDHLRKKHPKEEQEAQHNKLFNLMGPISDESLSSSLLFESKYEIRDSPSVENEQEKEAGIRLQENQCDDVKSDTFDEHENTEVLVDNNNEASFSGHQQSVNPDPDPIYAFLGNAGESLAQISPLSFVKQNLHFTTNTGSVSKQNQRQYALSQNNSYIPRAKKIKLTNHSSKPLSQTAWTYFEHRVLDGVSHAVCKNCPVYAGDYANSKFGKYRLDTADPSKSIEYHLRVAHPPLYQEYARATSANRWKRNIPPGLPPAPVVDPVPKPQPPPALEDEQPSFSASGFSTPNNKDSSLFFKILPGPSGMLETPKAIDNSVNAEKSCNENSLRLNINATSPEVGDHPVNSNGVLTRFSRRPRKFVGGTALWDKLSKSNPNNFNCQQPARPVSIEKNHDNGNISLDGRSTGDSVDFAEFASTSGVATLRRFAADEFLAAFLISCDLAPQIVENKYFEEFCKILNPDYKVPCGTCFESKVGRVAEKLKVNRKS